MFVFLRNNIIKDIESAKKEAKAITKITFCQPRGKTKNNH